MKRIGLFGGTFDPPQLAHLALARCARDTLPLDEVRWVPAGVPWQKTRAISDARHREAMVRLAIEGEPAFVLERCELQRAGPSVTLQTVRELQQREPGAAWFLLIGADQYNNLHTWRGCSELLGLVTLVVAERPGVALRPDPAVARVPHRVLPLPPLDISATDIRERVARGESIAQLVSAPVASYIDRHHLYTRRALDIRKLQRAIVDGLEDVKARDIVVFNTEHLSPLFERVIVASGTSNRQTKALASSVRETVKARGLPVLSTEGEENGEWIVVDCGAAVAHIMQPAIRDYYRLEEIWGGKPVRMKLDGESRPAVAGAAFDRPVAARPSRPSPQPSTPAKARNKAAPKKPAPAQGGGRRAATGDRRSGAKPAPAKKAPPARRAGAQRPPRGR